MQANSQQLKQLLYSSTATQHFSLDQLELLLKQSRENNDQNEITGLLLYRDGCFMQVLEGPENRVDEVYQSIRNDNRHKNLLIIYENPIEARQFAEWAMAYNGNQAEKIEGWSDFLQPYKSQHELNIPAGSVKKLIQRFKEITKR